MTIRTIRCQCETRCHVETRSQTLRMNFSVKSDTFCLLKDESGDFSVREKEEVAF